MTLALSLSPADLAALLCSRICHDLVSPVGAINNGMELYDEGGAEEAALDLIRLSAANASARLQFARIAFGAAGSAGSEIDTGDAEQVAKDYMKNEKAHLDWHAPRLLMPKNEIKFLLNLLLIANATIPRGGNLSVSIENKKINEIESGRLFVIKVEGKVLRIPSKFLELYEGKIPDEPIDAHAIQPYFTLLMAELSKMSLSIDSQSDYIVFTAQS
ncbi:histidine phosphotransferase ChpT [Bartonella tamiae]|uniref:Histidine phosphotransferase ChpT C-terminal domain-containing protein n=1 Tax=Bartonella tamiae Th239 TaxID=1094558 RepID=J1JW58_9HYPH|nr:histidine phosphotransferase family protein [Bartonella tamiae]EJF89232.1 hypothetical protein ME5_01783 [Bartonella tamiae Th239]EJF95364.1 hypothetical protein MEG_00097 [Bartonella tamiae Th307]